MAIWRIVNRISWSGGGGPGYNVFHCRRDTTGPDADSFLDELETFYTAISVVYRDDVTITVGESVIDVETAEFVESTPREVESTGTSSEAARLLQFVIPWRTAVRARRGMGRTYIGPLNSQAITVNGTPSSTRTDVIQTAAADLLAASEGKVLGAFGVWGYENPKPKNSPRDPEDPKVLRDWVGVGTIRPDGFSYLSSRRD